MELISRIEIAYFRSIYKSNMEELKGMNIIFGQNDSGKSNVLRALNLFFNNRTNPDQDFNFNRDFNHSRLSEADPSRDIRKFVYIKLWFKTPPSYQSSLGNEFWVKKQWSVSGGAVPHVESSITEKKYLQYLTRLVNRIRFHYIPAIKDRRIFEHLQEQIYNAISSNIEFSSSLEAFSSALQDRTKSLTESISSGLGEQSHISPPDDLSGLFRSLDFVTNGIHGDAYSLMLQRGDGIQVRHIPEILSFLSNESNENYHIWGFEEPENSLELVNAINEAKRFCTFASTDTIQIFLTSHSPAFFSLEDMNVTRHFVSKSETHGTRSTSKIMQIYQNDDKNPTELMGELPHLTVISSYLRDAHRRIQLLEEENDKIALDLQQRNRPVLFVEGESDQILLEAAWKCFFQDDQHVDIEPTKGTTKMEGLAKEGKIIDRLSPGRKVFVLVDNDKEGRDVYKNKHLKNVGKWHKHNSNGVLWRRLPFTKPFQEYMKSLNINEECWPGTIENLFSPEIKQKAIDEGQLVMKTIPHGELLNPEIYPKIEKELQSSDTKRYYLVTLDENYKIPFAKWVANESKTDKSILEPLRSIIEGIKKELNEDGEGH